MFQIQPALSHESSDTQTRFRSTTPGEVDGRNAVSHNDTPCDCVVLKFPIHLVTRFGATPTLDDATHSGPPSETLADAVDDFIENLRIRNFSEATIRGRINYLNTFVAWCDRHGLQCLNDITLAVMEDFQRHLYHYRKKDGQPISIGSQHAQLLPLRALFKWLAREKRIPQDPALEMQLPRAEHRLPRHVLTAREAERVLARPNVSTAQGLRDRAILETFYSTGIRRMELANLAITDIDFERGTVLVRRGKGRKDRTVPIGDRALSWIRRYMAEVRRKLVGDPDDGTLFLSCSRKRLTLDRLSQMVLEYVKAARIRKTGSCHLFRHTMATLLLEHGADIRFIQEMLGHAKLETTQIYTRVSIQKLKQVHKTCHPANFELRKRMQSRRLKPNAGYLPEAVRVASMSQGDGDSQPHTPTS